MSDDRLKEELRSIARYMVTSADSFDTGVLGESQRLALCIKALVYDGEGWRSIMGRLGMKNIAFYDYCPDYKPELELPFSGLAVRTISAKTARYLPRLDKDPRIKPGKLPFEAWWGKTVIADPDNDVRVTRGDIVLAVANTSMGAPDRKLAGSYEALGLSLPEAPVVGILIEWEETGAVLASSVRHIAFEVIKTLVDSHPRLLAEA